VIKRILQIVFVLCVILTISACGDNGSTLVSSGTHNNTLVALEVDKSVVVADGIDGATLTATVSGRAGAPIAGQEVQINVPPTLWFSNIPTAHLITDENGQVVLFLKTLFNPQNDAPVVVPQDDITVTCLGVTSTPVRLTINPGPHQITSSVTLVSDKVQAIQDGSDPITFTATVKDINGNPIAGLMISFKYELFSPQRYTDSNGIAVFVMTRPPFLQRAPTTNLSMTATSGSVTSNTVDVTFLAPPPAQVTLAADKSQASADGVETITFTATVKDKNGSPSPYQSIIFNVSPGANRYVTAISTDINGTAEMKLTVPPSTQPQTVISVTATSGTITSNSVVVTYSSPPQVTPYLVTLTSDKTTLISDGSDKVNFTIIVTDLNGKPLAGQAIRLNRPNCPYFSFGQALTNSSGTATASLYRYINSTWPLSMPEIISITATSNGAYSNVVNITITSP
jgi:adhesin/invasin